MTSPDKFFNREPIVLEGYVKSIDEKKVSIQIHPGLNVDVKRKDCKSVEEATDDLTGRTHVRVTLNPDAEISALFQPRLARLAAAKSPGIPFSVGGDLPNLGVMQRRAGGGGPVGPFPGENSTMGERATRSYVFLWGWINDDTEPYNDIMSGL